MSPRPPPKPLIGLTAGVQLEKNNEICLTCLANYMDAVRDAGGIPYLIPPLPADAADLAELRSLLAGIIFTGGPDLAGDFVAEHPESKALPPLRQNWDLALAKALRDWAEMPVLGICLGHQELNVAHGGTLHPHLPDLSTEIEHRKLTPEESMHPVCISPGSLLEKILGGRELLANSSHHQAVKDLADSLKITARANDGTIEAIELKEDSDRFFLGVQWHPERLRDAPRHQQLFSALVAAAQKKQNR